MKQEKKYWKYDLILLIPTIITYLALFCAPGNWQRIDLYPNFSNLSVFGKIWFNYPKIFDLFFKVRTSVYINILVSILLMFLIFVFVKNYKKDKRYYWFTLPILGMVINYVLYDKQYYRNPNLLAIVGTVILLSVFIAFIVYYIRDKKLQLLGFPIAAACSVFCLLMAPYMVERSTLPCIFIMFIPIISIGRDMFLKNNTLKVLIILLAIICTYYGLDNYAHIYIGYYKNYSTEVDNYNKLKNYKKYEKDNTLSLCKIHNDAYSSTQPYQSNFDYWIQQYFDLPTDLVMEWNDCHEKN